MCFSKDSFATLSHIQTIRYYTQFSISFKSNCITSNIWLLSSKMLQRSNWKFYLSHCVCVCVNGARQRLLFISNQSMAVNHQLNLCGMQQSFTFDCFTKKLRVLLLFCLGVFVFIANSAEIGVWLLFVLFRQISRGHTQLYRCFDTDLFEKLSQLSDVLSAHNGIHAFQLPQFNKRFSVTFTEQQSIFKMM